MTPTGSGRAWSLRRHRAAFVAAALGLAVGVAIGMYVHRWWGSGLFRPSSVVMVLALALIVLVVAIAIFLALRGQDRPAAISSILAAALVAGAIAGAALGPGYASGAQFAGTITVNATAPVAADWTGRGFCSTGENSPEVNRIWIMTWDGPGSPTYGQLVFIRDSGAPAFAFGTAEDTYDFFGREPRPTVEVKETSPLRLSGGLAFRDLAPSRSGLLPAFPGQPLDGSMSWSCDPTQPTHY
jgi:hypothetical protein